jgi:hypothetical protein
MSTESLVIGLTILLVAGLWVGAPLLNRRRLRQGDADVAHRQAERLQVHYDRLLTNLRDLDEDFATGKVQPGDYQAERERLVARGIQILMALDEHQVVSARPAASSAQTVSADSADVDADIDQEIEAAVAAYRQRTGDKIKTA